MDESQPPPLPETATPAATSLVSRLTNIFVAPGEVFDEVKVSAPNTMNWLLPSILACVMGIIFSVVIFSQETIVHDMRDAQEKQMQKAVDAGKMTKEQAEQAVQMMEKFMSPTMMTIFGSAGSVVGTFAGLFLFALIFWLMGKFLFKAPFGYMQAVEVNGLASMVSVLGGLLTMLVVLLKGNLLYTPGPSLLISQFDPANKTHLMLAAFNLTTVWWIAVLAIGLARLSGVSFTKAAAWLFGIWFGIRFGLILAGVGVASA